MVYNDQARAYFHIDVEKISVRAMDCFQLLPILLLIISYFRERSISHTFMNFA